MNQINILHLSDIHFGYENEKEITLLSQRDNALNSLIQKLKTVKQEWKPDIIVISGDLGWKGKEHNYKVSQNWIMELLQSLKLSHDHLLLCPGNHDIDRDKTSGMDYTDSSEKADKWLKIEDIENFERTFLDFSNFCEDINIPKLKIAQLKSHLVGTCDIQGLRFIILNSAWFCRGNDDKNKLWIGLPQLELMNSHNQLFSIDEYNSAIISLAVIHHPNDWLHEYETHSYSERPNTYKYLTERCHVILSGHVHGAIEGPHRIYNKAYLFTAGATYADKYYKNNFSIYKLDKNNRTLKRKSFEYCANDSTWQEIPDLENYQLSTYLSGNVLLDDRDRDEYDYAYLIEKSKKQVQTFVDNKSRVIARTNKLPELIERKIAWHSSEERISSKKGGELQLNTKNNISTLSEMVSSEKPTFLFGELGSGKSTLVGQYIIDLADNSKEILPLLIPASFFNDKEIKLVTDLERFINEFVNGQILPNNKDFKLIKALQEKIEITLVIDGFDELDSLKAQRLLTKLEEFRDNWSGLRIIATGRPIELAGLNYRNWQCLEMFPLTHEELNDLLLNEALADGLPYEQAIEDSTTRLNFLNERPELLGVATTPLAIRLIRSYLTEEIKKKSLGDLIYDVILERLGDWDKKDSKDTSFTEFKRYFPSPISRETLLGAIANEISESKNKSITKEQFTRLLKDFIKEPPEQNLIVEQAIEYLEKCILQKENNTYTFPSQPLFQGAVGIFIYEKLVNSDDNIPKTTNNNLWREYSFAATIARRKNKIDTIRMRLKKFIDDVLINENFIPSIAIIVSESEDEELAEYFINSLNKFDFRPLRYFQDIKTQSVRAIAHSIFLAGEIGFNWFYEEYLNPKYPTGIYFDNEQYFILQHWFTFRNFQLSSKQQEKLSFILKPHLEAQDWACYRLPETLVMVLPQLFNKDDELLMYVANLDSTLFGNIAINKLREEYKSGNNEKVLNALSRYILNNEDTKASVLKFWFELSNEFPPKEIVICTINKTVDEKNLFLLEELRKRMGDKTLLNVMRFYQFLYSKTAAASAINLYRFGVVDFYPIATGLLKGLHDGGKIHGAEEILHELIKKKGISGLSWLVDRFPECDSLSGAHSAYWRILLSELNNNSQIHINLLESSIASLGEFTLPRYPEIRLGFKKLLSTKPEYRNYLNDLLKSMNKYVRYNSACILLSCFPESEKRACEIIINSTSVYYERHEWWRFCLRLSLGKDVLDYVLSKLEKLLPIPQVFALTLLYHNKYKLSIVLFEQLILGLLSSRSRFDDVYSIQDDSLVKILAQDESYELLIKNLTHGNIDIARNASKALLSYHRDKLDDQNYCICWGLNISNTFRWQRATIDQEITYITNNENRLTLVKEIFNKIQKETSHETLASLYLRAIDDEQVWKDILWSSLINDKWIDHTEVGISCLWIFSKARKNTKIAQVIGKAATEFIDHPSLANDRLYNDIIPWLAFLAHEFGLLDKNKIEHTLNNFQPISEEINSALIARLGYCPSNFHSRHGGSSKLIFKGFIPRLHNEPDFQTIVDVTRDSLEIHNDIADCIERAILFNKFSVNELEGLSLKSKFGCAFSIIVLFSRNEFEQTDLLVKILGLELSRNAGENNSVKILLQALRNIIASIKENPQLNEKFFTDIKNSIKSRNHDNIIELYKILLTKEELFEISDLTNLLSEISERTYEWDLTLAHNLIRYFLKVSQEQKQSVLFEIKKIISAINEKIDRYDSEYIFEGLNKLLFSLVVFYFQQEIDEESCNVFLNGLEYVFINYYAPINARDMSIKRLRGKEILKVISPLLNKINPRLIKECIEKGASAEKPELSSLCNLLISLR